MKEEIRLAGSGGQGVILASIILADAAVLSGNNAAQSQAYGPEARGGACKAEVVISDEKIRFGKVLKPSFLLALNQKAADTFAKDLPKETIVMLDESINTPEGLKENTVIRLPILETAREKVGKAFTANIVAVGAVNNVLHISDSNTLFEAVKLHIPKGTEEINLKALSEGEKLKGSNE